MCRFTMSQPTWGTWSSYPVVQPLCQQPQNVVPPSNTCQQSCCRNCPFARTLLPPSFVVASQCHLVATWDSSVSRRPRDTHSSQAQLWEQKASGWVGQAGVAALAATTPESQKCNHTRLLSLQTAPGGDGRWIERLVLREPTIFSPAAWRGLSLSSRRLRVV